MSTEVLEEALEGESPNQSSSSSSSEARFDSCWQSYVALEACMRLCVVKRTSSLLRQNKVCQEATELLADDCALLKAALSIHDTAPRENIVGMIKIQALKVRMSPKLDSDSNLWKSRLSSLFAVKESYLFLPRLQSSPEESPLPMLTREIRTILLHTLDDELILQVLDSKGNYLGQVVLNVFAIFKDMIQRWYFIFREPGHEVVGKIRLRISCTPSSDASPKAVSFVTETLVYDMVLEGAMKAQNFHQGNLSLTGKWKWLLSEFASYYGVSEAYTNLRYLSRIMDVATPTADCISLVYGLLLPVMEEHRKNTLSRLESRLLGEIEEQIEQILTLVFENYKSLDEQSPSGIVDNCTPDPKAAAPVLEQAVKLYELIHDISSPEAQNKLCSYFQAAASKRSRHHLTETDEYVRRRVFMDPEVVSTACEKMKSLCLNVRNDILVDVEIHNCNILPSFISLPTLSSAIYTADLLRRVGAFLAACPPTAPSSHVTDVVIATADLVKDIAKWNIN